MTDPILRLIATCLPTMRASFSNNVFIFQNGAFNILTAGMLAPYLLSRAPSARSKSSLLSESDIEQFVAGDISDTGQTRGDRVRVVVAVKEKIGLHWIKPITNDPHISPTLAASILGMMFSPNDSRVVGATYKGRDVVLRDPTPNKKTLPPVERFVQ